jgi:hypothetical protein
MDRFGLIHNTWSGEVAFERDVQIAGVFESSLIGARRRGVSCPGRIVPVGQKHHPRLFLGYKLGRINNIDSIFSF